jgi:hypothetical protein
MPQNGFTCGEISHKVHGLSYRHPSLYTSISDWYVKRCDQGYLWYGSCLLPGEAGRLVYQCTCLDSNVLRISTTIGQAKDFIPYRKSVGSFCTDFSDDTGAFYAQDRSGLRGRRVFSEALTHIHAIEPKRLDLNEHLSRS